MPDEALPAAESGDARQRLRAIGSGLVSLQACFSKNVLDAVGAWTKDVGDEGQLAGIPRVASEEARRRARRDKVGGFRLTLDPPMVDAVMRCADDRELRREVYEAHTTRASDRGPHSGRFDNGPIIDAILPLRHERANLLGFRTHADTLAKAHASGTADGAERFLLELQARLRASAQAELEEVWTFAKTRDAIKGFRPWDLSYYAEQLTRTRPGFCPSALASVREIELALFDLRLHRDYVPADRASKLRSHVLDTFAQVRREVSLLPPPPWDRAACALVEIFGDGEVGGDYYARLVRTRAGLSQEQGAPGHLDGRGKAEEVQ
jgi:Zn-dependent oligopeptidase